MSKFVFDESVLSDDYLLYSKLCDLCNMIISRHFYANTREKEDLVSVGVTKALSMISDGHWDPRKGRLMSFLYTGMRNEMHNYLYRISREILYDDYYEESYTDISLEEPDILSIDFKYVDDVCKSFISYGDLRDYVVMNLEDNGFKVTNYKKDDLDTGPSLPKVWTIRAGKEDEANGLFMDGGLIALGWNDAGDVRKYPNKDDFKEHLYSTYTSKRPRAVSLIAGQLYRFSNEVMVGDYALYPSRRERCIYFGKVFNDYEYNESYDSSFPHVRNVRWVGKFSRDEFSRDTLNGLGSFLRFFSMGSYEKEILSKISVRSKIMLVDRESDFASRSKEFQDDFINRLSGAVLWKSRESFRLSV